MCPLPNSYVDAITLIVTVFGDKAFKEGLTLSEVIG